MKILLYAEPTLILKLPFPMNVVYRDHLYSWISKNILNHDNVEIKSIIPDIALRLDKKDNLLKKINPISFNDEDLGRLFPNECSLEAMYLKVFNNNLTENEYIIFKNIMQNKLGKWEPDVVITYPIHNSLLKNIYPKAMHLLVENGIFSRPPFNCVRVFRYEPIHFLNGFLNHYEKEIRNFKITKIQQQSLSDFKSKLRRIIDENNPMREELLKLKSEFRYLVLCPIPSDNLYKETKYDDQYLFLMNILKNIPSDVGLIITFHDKVESQLNHKIINTLQQRYKNLIYFPVSDNSYVSQSLNYFEYCDAIINMHTMTGTQAMLWDMKVISLDKNYSKSFCDKQGLDDIEKFLSEPKKDNSSFLYWYLTHYAVFQKNFDKPGWYYNYFKTKLEKFRKEGITFDFYEQIEDFEELSRYILNYVRNFYAGKKSIKKWRHKFYKHYKTEKYRVYVIMGKSFQIKRSK